MNRQTERQINRQIDRQKDIQTDRQINRKTNRQLNLQTERQTDGQINRQQKKQTNKQIDRQLERRTDKIDTPSILPANIAVLVSALLNPLTVCPVDEGLGRIQQQLGYVLVENQWENRTHSLLLEQILEGKKDCY